MIISRRNAISNLQLNHVPPFLTVTKDHIDVRGKKVYSLDVAFSIDSSNLIG